MRTVIGIDGGGTRTRAVLASLEGKILGTGNAGSSNYNHVGEVQAGRNLAEAVGMAWRAGGLEPRPAEAAFLGLAGVINEADRATIRGLVEEHQIARLCGINHDIRIALTGGLTGDPGIALIAGTGSSCYGRNRQGDPVQVGGLGSLADDGGSASWIGRRALQIAVREADGRFEETEMKGVVFGYLGIEHQRDFLHRVHILGLSREEMGRMAPLIIDLYRAGNEPARTIVEEGVAELTLLVATAARLLGLDGPAVILSGGLALSGEPVTPLLRETIRDAVWGATFPNPLLPPAGGATLEALQLLNVPPTITIINHLKESKNL